MHMNVYTYMHSYMTAYTTGISAFSHTYRNTYPLPGIYAYSHRFTFGLGFVYHQKLDYM